MARKRAHRRRGEVSLACELMRAGKLDVNLATGQVSTWFGPEPRSRKARAHYKGYLFVDLMIRPAANPVDSSGKRRRGRKQSDGTRAIRMSAWVHRLVWMKKLALDGATDAGPGCWKSWREFVFDLPPSLDIDHKDLNRANNAVSNLELRTHAGNSSRVEMSQAEAAKVEREMREFMAS